MEKIKEKYRKMIKDLKNCEKISNSKSYFLAQAAHDLRQPLQAMHIFTSMLLETDLTEEQEDLAKKIEYSAVNMRDLLSNYLDLSKLDYGGFKYEEKEFCIRHLTDKLAEEFSFICRLHGVKLQYIPCSLKIKSDPILVERMLRNLLTNAIKYTKNKIVFGCKRKGNKVLISIIDNGCGIHGEDIPYIFDEFYQSGQNPENKRHGAGLGLAIVKKIADLINTKIRVDTSLGKGTSFSFSLG